MVTAENCFDIIRLCGIRPWQKINEEPVERYLRRGEEQSQLYSRFGAPSTVGYYTNPGSSTPFEGFRTHFKPCAMVFALIDGHVPITAEWKHGAERITLCPVAGVAGKAEQNYPTVYEQMEAAARREWEEETGTQLASLTPLGPSTGILAIARSANARYYPFLGTVREPIQKGPTKLDSDERLQMVMFPVAEWVRLLMQGDLMDQHPHYCIETYTRDTTFAALMALGKLQLQP